MRREFTSGDYGITLFFVNKSIIAGILSVYDGNLYRSYEFEAIYDFCIFDEFRINLTFLVDNFREAYAHSGGDFCAFYGELEFNGLTDVLSLNWIQVCHENVVGLQPPQHNIIIFHEIKKTHNVAIEDINTRHIEILARAGEIAISNSSDFEMAPLGKFSVYLPTSHN